MAKDARKRNKGKKDSSDTGSIVDDNDDDDVATELAALRAEISRLTARAQHLESLLES